LRVARKQGVVLTRTGDQALLVDDEGGHVHVVNESAARVWELCDGSPSAEALVESFARAYGKEPATVQADVGRILETYSSLGVVELTDKP
jgi:PqqD family protein of HPr-rel-A system